MKENLKLTFYGGAGKVTGANFLLEKEGGFNLMVDCGLIQGVLKDKDENSKPFAYNPSDVDVLFITHAHIDHIGRIPKLVKDGFTGEIYSTEETKELAQLMFADAINVMRFEAQKRGKNPIYGIDDVNKSLSLWKILDYHTVKQIDDYSIVLKDSGHILGSAMIEISYKGKKIVFSGDLGNSPTPLLRDTEKIEDTDYLIMESVYGDRNHEDVKDRTIKLQKIIEKIIENKGTLIIPAFSLERTQVLLFELHKLMGHGKIQPIPVFLDSPLAIKITEVYKKYAKHFNKKTKHIIASGDDIFKFPLLKFTSTREESKEINKITGPKIIIAGSGMSRGGRVIFHEKEYLPDPKNILLLVGFQIPGGLGRQLQDGLKEVRIFDKKIKVRAQVESIMSYSSHKDSDGLFGFVEQTKDSLNRVYVAMGEPKSSLFLAQRIREYLEVEAIVPEINKTYELEI